MHDKFNKESINEASKEAMERIWFDSLVPEQIYVLTGNLLHELISSDWEFTSWKKISVRDFESLPIYKFVKQCYVVIGVGGNSALK